MYRSYQYLKGGPAQTIQQPDVEEEPIVGIYGGFFLGVVCMLLVVALITLAISGVQSCVRWWRGSKTDAEDIESTYSGDYQDDPDARYDDINSRPADDPYEAARIASLMSFDTNSSPPPLIQNVPEMQRLLRKFRHAMIASQNAPDDQQSYERMEELRRQITEIVMRDTRYRTAEPQLPTYAVESLDPPPAYNDVASCETRTPPAPSVLSPN